jgi:hypothetical protein
MQRNLVPIAAMCMAMALATLTGVAVASATEVPHTSSDVVAATASVCRPAQLSVTWGGQTGAAGTVATGIAIHDSTKTSCQLTGYPSVGFYSGTPSALHRITVSVNHTGAGTAFSKHPGSVPFGEGGFVVLSRDFNSNGSVNCPQVTVAKLRLPGVAHTFEVRFSRPSNVCGSTPPVVSISAMMPSSTFRGYVG